MAGPRIYTESWERLKTAAREMEEKEAENGRNGTKHAPKPKRELTLPTSRAFVVATLVLSALCVLLGVLWFDAQNRLVQATKEAGELRAQLDLIHERFRNMDKDRERMVEENALLRREEEETRAEAVARERELENLKTQREKAGIKPKSPVAKSEIPSAPPQVRPMPSAQPVPAAPIQEKPPLQTLEKTDQQDVKTYTIR